MNFCIHGLGFDRPCPDCQELAVITEEEREAIWADEYYWPEKLDVLEAL